MHEHSHHFIGENDHNGGYGIARYFTAKILANQFGGKVISLPRKKGHLIDGEDSLTAWALCRDKGYTNIKSSASKVGGLYKIEADVYLGHGKTARVKESMVFTESRVISDHNGRVLLKS